MINKFSKKTIDKTPKSILKNQEWFETTQKIKLVVVLMKLEYQNVPETELTVYPYREAFMDILIHLEFLSEPEKCLQSWKYNATPFSLGSRMEFSMLTFNPFFYIKDEQTLKELKLSPHFQANFIRTMDILENREWQEITQMLKGLVSEMKNQLQFIPEDKYIERKS